MIAVRPILRSIPVLALLLAFGRPLCAQLLQERFWMPNGSVNTMARTGDTVYIGGSFSRVAPPEPNGAVMDRLTGAPQLDHLNPDGAVNSAAPDGAGGWYIGGAFTHVGGQERNRIAHLDHTGQLTPFAASTGFNGAVNALLLEGQTLYAGGAFTGYGSGVAAGSGSALDSTDGSPLPGHAMPNGPVFAIAPDGAGGWYIGGSFTQVGGQMRGRLARINADGTLHPWNPSAGGTVNAIAVDAGTVYVGGVFSTIGGQSRKSSSRARARPACSSLRSLSPLCVMLAARQSSARPCPAPTASAWSGARMACLSPTAAASAAPPPAP